MSVKYKRVLLKLSGEAISGGNNGIINFEFLTTVAGVIKKCLKVNKANVNHGYIGC